MPEKSPGPPRYLTPVQVADACGVSPRTVSNWIRTGSIPAHRTAGGHGRVSAEDLRRFLIAHRVPLPPGLAAGQPADEGGATAGVPEGALAPSSGGSAVEQRRARRVLVIDDDEVLLEVFREVLTRAGFEVEVARHGFLAGYLVGHARPDAVILDILMPGLDGYEVLALMRRRPEARGIPVLACTSLKGADVEARLSAAGFDGYVRKPIDFRALVEQLRARLR